VLAHPVEVETDRGPGEAHKARARLCLATGEVKPIA
jgi:hypothetical protein